MDTLLGYDSLCLQTKSLPSSHGCDNMKTLDLYESTDVYSISKCRLECQAKSLNEHCNCKAPYMPGISTLTAMFENLFHTVLYY